METGLLANLAILVLAGFVGLRGDLEGARTRCTRR